MSVIPSRSCVEARDPPRHRRSFRLLLAGLFVSAGCGSGGASNAVPAPPAETPATGRFQGLTSGYSSEHDDQSLKPFSKAR